MEKYPSNNGPWSPFKNLNPWNLSPFPGVTGVLARLSRAEPTADCSHKTYGELQMPHERNSIGKRMRDREEWAAQAALMH